jgi:hypothetical protein
MRVTRVLALLGALAAPGLGVAQSIGAIVGDEGDDLFINADECAGGSGATIGLAWRVQGTSTSGVYRMFASNKAPTTSDAIEVCATENETTSSTFAGRVLTTSGEELVAQAGDATGNAIFPIDSFVLASNRTCDTDATIHVCVHHYAYQTGTQNPDLSTVRASAVATITLSVGKPAAPVDVSVSPGDKRLYVQWAAGSGGGAEASDYLIVAAPTSGTSPVQTDTATGTSGVVDGLVNEQEYEVMVFARSASGTASDPSEAVLGTPKPVDDFWEVYRKAGGTESGGCGGPAGPLALAGLAGVVLAARRRRTP